MGHTAAVYSVVVRPVGDTKDLKPLGDFDGQGAYLGDVLQKIFADEFAAKNAKTEKAVRCTSSELSGEDLQLEIQHGEGGVAAQIMNAAGKLAHKQVPDDTQLMDCGALLRLPKAESRGWFAVHLNNGRHIKGLVELEMVRRFQKKYPDLKLVIKPSVQGKVLEEALDNGQLHAVKLVKYDRPSDDKDAGKWVAADTQARLELRIRAVQKAKRLLPDLVKKAMGGDVSAFGQIVEYDNMTFDQAKVEIAIGGDSHRRTFNLQNLEAGHPFTTDIDPKTEEGVPVAASIFSELGTVIDDLE